MSYEEKDKDELDDNLDLDLDEDIDDEDLDSEEDEDLDSDEDSDEDPEEDDDDEGEDEEVAKKKNKLDFDSMEKDEVVKIARSALAQKNKYKNKVKELAEKKEVATEEKPVSNKPAKKAKDADQGINNERIDFRLDHPDLKKKEVEQIEKFAKANGMSMEESLKEGVIRTYLRERKKKREALEGSPTTRGKGAPLRRRGEKDWSTATPEELAEHRRKVILRGK